MITVDPKTVDALVDGFMGARERYAPKHTVRREVFDGVVNATLIDRGTKIILAELELAAEHRNAAAFVVTNLIKFLFDLETRRFENGGHTNGHDLTEAAKQRARSAAISSMMKASAKQHEALGLWTHPEAREATRRIADLVFQEQGVEHKVPVPARR